MATPAVRVEVKLNNGASIHQLGFGTWQAPKGEVGRAIDVAIRNGFRHIDAAAIYQNEAEVGEALSKVIKEGVVKREDLFITTKLWNTHHKPEDVQPALEASLKRLQLDYVDLYLIHWPVAWVNKGKDFDDFSACFPENDAGGCEVVSVAITDTWKAMEKVHEAKLAKAIGVSNFTVEELKEVLKIAKVKPAAHQIECHPGLPQDELKALHKEHGIVTEAYCPLGIGMGSIEHSLLKHPEIEKLAKAEDTTAADILLRWNLQAGNIVLSKSVTSERVVQNAATTTEPLKAETLEALKRFAKEHPLRVCNPESFHAEPKQFFPTDAPANYSS